MKKFVALLIVTALCLATASAAEASCGRGHRIVKGARWLKNHIPLVRRIGR